MTTLYYASSLARSEGCASAQLNLGVMYSYGLGAVQNYATTLDYFRQAAAQGHALAQFNLGVMHELGKA